MPMDFPAPITKVSRNTQAWCGCLGAVIFGALILETAFHYMFLPALGAPPVTALENVKHISKALRHYAQDHDGKFPESSSSSNQAYRKLFPEYMEDEKVFFVAGSAWHAAARNHRPDGDIGGNPDFAQSLEKGENHWAYVTGLATSSPPKTPLIAGGFVEGQPGIYTDAATQKGGVWKGKKAIVVFVDGSAEQIKLSRRENFRVMVKNPDSRRKVDIFTREGGLPENAQVLNPE